MSHHFGSVHETRMHTDGRMHNIATSGHIQHFSQPVLSNEKREHANMQCTTVHICIHVFHVQGRIRVDHICALRGKYGEGLHIVDFLVLPFGLACLLVLPFLL